MRAALAEAARGEAAAEVPVGCVVVGPGGEILARAHNERAARVDPTAHAEVLALRAAAGALGDWRLTGCTVVVTLEPCTMCAGAIVLARVDRVVFATRDVAEGAVGGRWDVVRDTRVSPRPAVVSGVLADEAAALLRRFFAARRS